VFEEIYEMGIKDTFLKQYLLLLFAIIIWIAFSFGISIKASASTPKSKSIKDYNIIMIWIDTLRADHLSCYGYKRKTSPNIDKLAMESIVSENNFTPHTVTLPSFMSIITSLYPGSHGVLYIAKDKLSPKVKTLAQILQIYGYKGTWFGPGRDPHLDPNIGFGRGFDTVGIFPNDLSKGREILFEMLEKNKNIKFFLNFHTYNIHAPYMPSIKYKEKFTKKKMKEVIENFDELEKLTVDAFKDGIYKKNKIVSNELGKKLASEMRLESLFNKNYMISKKNIISFLEKKNKKYLWDRIILQIYKATMNPKNKEIMNHTKTLYDATILEFDTEIVGPLIDKLKKLNIYEKTIIVICADHGEEFGEHARLGHGETLYEEVISVPLIIKVPWINKGLKLRELTQTIDITPTILDLVGIPPPEHAQGKSLLPLINKAHNLPFREYVFGNIPDEKLSIRSKDWKFIITQNKKIELYYLFDDPGEREDLFNFALNFKAYRRKIAARLEQDLIKWESALPSYKVNHSFLPHIDKKTQEKIKKEGYW
jgi:arylsulfatase A-like enzyme